MVWLNLDTLSDLKKDWRNTLYGKIPNYLQSVFTKYFWSRFVKIVDFLLDVVDLVVIFSVLGRLFKAGVEIWNESVVNVLKASTHA